MPSQMTHWPIVTAFQRWKCNLRSGKWKTDWSRISQERYLRRQISDLVCCFMTKWFLLRWALLRRRLRSWEGSLRLPRNPGAQKATALDISTRAGGAGTCFCQDGWWGCKHSLKIARPLWDEEVSCNLSEVWSCLHSTLQPSILEETIKHRSPNFYFN